MNNKERALKIKRLLGLEENQYNDKNKYVRVADVLCDLKHYCILNNIDWLEEQIISDNYFALEKDE